MSKVEMNKLKVYIAAPFFNPEQLEVVQRIEALLKDHDIAYFSPRFDGTLRNMDAKERAKKMGAMFRSNVDHMDWCTHCIAVIDDYDTGTVWEMGYLYATHKSIITYSDNYHGINVMLNEAIDAHCVTYDTLVPGLKGLFKTDKTSEVT